MNLPEGHDATPSPERVADLVRALQGMIHDLFPFNYVVPEQSQNGILGLDDLAEGLGLAREVAAEHWNLAEVEYPGSPAPTPRRRPRRTGGDWAAR